MSAAGSGLVVVASKRTHELAVFVSVRVEATAAAVAVSSPSIVMPPVAPRSTRPVLDEKTMRSPRMSAVSTPAGRTAVAAGVPVVQSAPSPLEGLHLISRFTP